jgi:uncharacterized protein (TIRG00374 family)
MNQVDVRMDWRRWLLLVVFLGLTALVFSRFTDFKGLVTTLSQGHWPWVVAGILLHAAYFLMNAKLYQLCFVTVGVDSNVWQLLPVIFGAFFINVVVPAGGAAGGALFVGDAIRRGQSGARAAVGTVLVLLCDLSTLIPLIVVGIVFLRLENRLYAYDTITSAIFVFFILFLIAALFLAWWKPGVLRGVLAWVRLVVNRIAARFRRPDLVGEDWADRNAEELGTAAGAIAAHPQQLARALGWAFLMHVVNLAGLYAFFLAFRQTVQLGTLVAGFSMGIVFWVISIIPQGVAAVEGIMSLVFTSMGIPGEKTAAIVLAFRGVNFYLPLIFGFFLLRYATRFVGGSKPSNVKEPITDSARGGQAADKETPAAQNEEPCV